SGREGRLAFGGGFSFFTEIKVVTRRFRTLHALPGALAYGAISQSRRNHERFLGTANDHIHAPSVHVEVSGAETGDCVDDEQRVRGVVHGLRDTFNIVAHAGGTFCRLHVNDAYIGRELVPDFV